MSGHLERLEAHLERESVPLHLAADLRAAVAELKQLRAEREGWVRGARQRLRHAYRTGWDGHARAMLAALAEGGLAAEERAAAYVAEWWDNSARLAAEVEADAAPQQQPELAPCCGGPHAGWMHTADCAGPQSPLHARCAHPAYEYATTQGPRKRWDHSDEPPEGFGWERNVDAGRNGWERFEYHEESYWRRTKSPAPQQPERGGEAP